MRFLIGLGLVLALGTACGDAAVSGTNVPPTMSVGCASGATDGSCDLGFCPDGSRVPATRTCIGGQFICQPVMPGCARVETDAGTPDVSVPADVPSMPDVTPMEEPVLTINYMDTRGGPVYVGRNNIILQWSRLEARRDVDVTELRFHFEALDAFSRLSDADGNVILRNIRLRDEGTGQTLGGPLELRPGANARTMVARFTDSFRLLAGQGKTVTLTADISPTVDPSLIGSVFRILVDGDNGRYFPTNAVRTTDSMVVAPEMIANNVVTSSANYTLRRPTLAVNMSNTLHSHVVVKRAMDVSSLALTLTADVSDVRVTEIRLNGVGDVGSGFNRSNFARVVVACRLHYGSTAVSPFMTPDETYGIMHFTGLSLVIPRGESRTYSVSCNLDSVVENMSLMNRGDRYAIGIGPDSDVRIDPISVGDPGVVVDTSLTQQIYAPTVVVGVYENGIVGANRTRAPESLSLEGGHPPWYRVGTYRFGAALEDMVIDRIAVRWTGNAACVANIAVMDERGSEPLGLRVVASGTNHTDIVLTSPIRVTPDGRTLDIRVMLNPVTSSDTGPTGCHVGDMLTFGLGANLTDGEWDAHYRDRYNFRAVGSVSGNVVYPDSIVLMGDTVTMR